MFCYPAVKITFHNQLFGLIMVQAIKPPRDSYNITCVMQAVLSMHQPCTDHPPMAPLLSHKHKHTHTVVNTGAFRQDSLSRTDHTLHVVYLYHRLLMVTFVLLYFLLHRETCWRRVHQRSNWKWKCNASHPLRTNQTLKCVHFKSPSLIRHFPFFAFPLRQASEAFSSPLTFNPLNPSM